MILRRVLMAFLVVAVLANAALVLDALTLGVFVPATIAQVPAALPSGPESVVELPHAADAGPDMERETYSRLVDELKLQRERLEEKARGLLERERQLTVAREELKSERETIEAERKALAQAQEDFKNLGTPNFDRLLKAYEGMDPENASAALAELYRRDRKVVIDILLGMKARQAAQTLDALAATHAQQAADLSLEIWQRDPKRGITP